jgi:hypothetical protein
MLGLERKATLPVGAPRREVRVKAQPFGGAVRLRDPAPLRALLGELRFDSRRSQDEKDFRILIRRPQWPAVRAFCLPRLEDPDDRVLESTPDRELTEEIWDALGVWLKAKQFDAQPLATLIEDNPSRTDNVHAPSLPTVRMYRLFEVRILDEPLIRCMLESSARISDPDLRRQALEYSGKHIIGRANAVLTLPLEQLAAFYRAMPPEQRGEAASFGGRLLDGNVAAIVPDLYVPKFQNATF